MREQSEPHWEDVEHDGTLVTFSIKNSLKVENLGFDDGVLIFPRNALLANSPPEKNLFPDTTKELEKAFIDAGLGARIYSDNREKSNLILKTTDVIFPVLLFVSHSARNLGFGILASWIYDRYLKPRNIDAPQIRVEYAEIDRDGNIRRWQRIEAPASELHAVLSNGAGLLNTESKSLLAIDKREDQQDDWAIHCKNEAKVARAVADELLKESKKFVDKQDLKSAERISRRALKKLREAYLWEPHIIEHIKYLHRIGALVHDQFMCVLEYRDGSYRVTCPVLLSHSKGGFSIGGSARRICSVCGKDMIDCPHVKRQGYDNVVALRYDGMCNICRKEECGHDEGKTYNGVRAFGIVVEMSLDHISFVEKPANPLSVIQGYTISEDEILQSLPEEEGVKAIPEEAQVYCHHCLNCDGPIATSEK